MKADDIAKLVSAALKANESPLSILTHVEPSAVGDHLAQRLRYLTDTPSGRTYGALTLGDAADWLSELGIRVAGEDVESLAPEEYEVELQVSGTVYAVVSAHSREEAERIAEDDFCLSDVDVDVEAVFATRLADRVTRQRRSA